MMPEEPQSDAPPPAAPAASGAVSRIEPADEATLSEDLALSLLKDHSLPAEVVEQIGKNTAVLKSRKVRMAVAAHPSAPGRLVLRLIREFYTFDLARFSLMPTVAPDLKRVAEELLISRLASITLGERISLSRRASARVASALLLDKEGRVWQTALENPRLTEAAVVGVLHRPGASAALADAVAHHPKWSSRHEVRLALLRSPHTPLARALEFARQLPAAQLRDILHHSRLSERTKVYLQKELESKDGR